MAIPRKVQEAADRAEALHREVYETSEPETPTEAVQEEPDQTTSDAQAPDDSSVSQQEPAATPPNEQPDERGEEQTWEQRFKVLDGKYTAEVPRVNAANRELKRQLKTLTDELEKLKAQSDSKTPSLISEEDRQKYGDDLLDVIKRAAQEQVAAKEVEIADLKRKLEEVSNTTAKTVDVSFFDRLGQLVPDWVSINSDDSFLKWLDEYDEFTGRTRQDLLSEAEQSREADRVARFFTRWKQSQESTATNRQRSLESQVAPDSNRVAKPPVGKRHFTRQEIADFYSAARRGEIGAKEMVAMEAEIHAATLDNRIR